MDSIKQMGTAIVGGMGLLIFAYLIFKYKDASIGLTNAGFSGSNSLVKTLQGR